MSIVAEHYDAGLLAEAIGAAEAAVKAKPTDGATRRLLCQLLVVAGEFDRADRQFDTLGSLALKEAPKEAAAAAAMRHVIRAAVARRDFYDAGAVPEFLSGVPTAHQKLLLEAFVHQREGDAARAVELLEEAERIRPRLPGACGDSAFADFRDADDLLAGVFEVYRGGKYFWIPAEEVVGLDFEPPRSPLDLWARTVHLTLRRGDHVDEHTALMPVVYGVLDEADDLCRLARSTKWVRPNGGPVRGVGQRVFALSDGIDLDILDLQSVAFSTRP